VRTLCLAALVVGGWLALAPTAQAAQSKGGRGCASRGSETVARSVEARLYTRSRGADHRLVGCLVRTGKRRVLDSWYDCGCSIGDEQPSQVWLSGRYAALNRWSCSPIDPMAPCSGRLRVIDVRSGRARHTADTGGSLSALLVKRNGSVAFLLGERLMRIDSSGAAVLDEGPGIDPLSLAASRNRLYWMRGGAPQSAPFA
jgi:hypothetical protein